MLKNQFKKSGELLIDAKHLMENCILHFTHLMNTLLSYYVFM